MKERILAEAKKRKPKSTVEMRKKNWETLKELRAQNKYAILVCNKIYTIGLNLLF